MNDMASHFLHKYVRFIRIALIILLLSIFAERAEDIFHDPLEGDFESLVFDENTLAWLEQFRTDFVTQLMIDLTALGSLAVLAVAFSVATFLLWHRRDWVAIIYLATVGTGAMGLAKLLKHVFGRVRPDIDSHLVKVSDLSFPSGHALGSSAMYMALAYLLSRYFTGLGHFVTFHLIAATLIGFVAISRMYLGVHYPSDIVGGICIGVSWALFVTELFSKKIKTSP